MANDERYVFYGLFVCKVIEEGDTLVLDQLLKDDEFSGYHYVPNTEGDGKEEPRTITYEERVTEAARLCYHRVIINDDWTLTLKFPKFDAIEEWATLFNVRVEDILNLDSTSEYDLEEEDQVPF